MKTSHRTDPGELISGVLQVAVAVLALLTLRQRARQGARMRLPPAGRHGAGAVGSAAFPDANVRQHPQAEAGALRRASRPRALLRVAVSAAKEWSDHRAASKGAALSLYTLFSLAPMLILVVAIAGFFFGQDAVRDLLLQQMAGLMGEQGGQAVRTILAGARHQNGGLAASLISLGLVLVSATSAFAELKGSLDELWEVPPSNKSGLWSFVRERILSFGLILVLALMLLISLAVSTALEAMDSIWPGGAGSPLKILSVALSHLVSFGIVTGLFAVIFKYLPATRIAWRDVLVGALMTAMLFIVGKALIGIYVARADISSAYGAAGSVVILITWVYYSAQIFFYGSLFTHEYALKLGSRSHSGDSESIPNRAARPGAERDRLERALS